MDAPDLGQLVDQHAVQPRTVGEDLLEVGDQDLQFLELVLQFEALQGGQPAQAHVQDRLGLHVGEGEALDQRQLGVRGRAGATDQGDDLVEVVQGREQPFHHVGPLPRLVQAVAGAARDHLALVGHVVLEHRLEAQCLGRVVDQ